MPQHLVATAHAEGQHRSRCPIAWKPGSATTIINLNKHQDSHTLGPKTLCKHNHTIPAMSQMKYGCDTSPHNMTSHTCAALVPDPAKCFAVSNFHAGGSKSCCNVCCAALALLAHSHKRRRRNLHDNVSTVCVMHRPAMEDQSSSPTRETLRHCWANAASSTDAPGTTHAGPHCLLCRASS
jgi:hypothetical protein